MYICMFFFPFAFRSLLSYLFCCLQLDDLILTAAGAINNGIGSQTPSKPPLYPLFYIFRGAAQMLRPLFR